MKWYEIVAAMSCVLLPIVARGPEIEIRDRASAAAGIHGPQRIGTVTHAHLPQIAANLLRTRVSRTLIVA